MEESFGLLLFGFCEPKHNSSLSLLVYSPVLSGLSSQGSDLMHSLGTEKGI